MINPVEKILGKKVRKDVGKNMVVYPYDKGLVKEINEEVKSSPGQYYGGKIIGKKKLEIMPMPHPSNLPGQTPGEYKVRGYKPGNLKKWRFLEMGQYENQKDELQIKKNMKNKYPGINVSYDRGF